MKKVFSRPRSLKPTPFHYCPGCGHSILHRILGEVIDEMDLREKIIGVPPAGCAVLAYNYFDIDMGEAAHGRAVALATGLKRALPDRIIFTYQGDGDIAAIGTAETIHAAAGENVTTVFVNNAVYGMTGQMVTTVLGQHTTTSGGRRTGWIPDQSEKCCPSRGDISERPSSRPNNKKTKACEACVDGGKGFPCRSVCHVRPTGKSPTESWK
jgi:pyruvate/2-oxoacid:ferredoxin oxidoreductase beta subunit